MRIALKVGTTVYPLAGEAGVSERTHSSAGDFQIGAQAERQVIPRVRANYVQIVDRGNLMHTVRFTTARQFATPAEAFLATLDHDGLTPRAGVLVLDAVAPDGGIYRRLLASAVVTPPARRVIGATALYDYSVDGGAITDGGYFAAGVVSLVVTGILSNGSGPVVFPTLYEAGMNEGYPYYTATGDPFTGSGAEYICAWSSGAWGLQAFASSTPVYQAFAATSTVATPDLATGWTAFLGSGVPTIDIG